MKDLWPYLKLLGLIVLFVLAFFLFGFILYYTWEYFRS